MTKGLAALLLAVLCAVVTAISAYIAGATPKALMMRVMTSAVIAGSLGLIVELWLHEKTSCRTVSDNTAGGHMVDIEISDNTPENLDNIPENNEWQPLHAAQISEADTRVIPARK